VEAQFDPKSYPDCPGLQRELTLLNEAIANGGVILGAAAGEVGSADDPIVRLVQVLYPYFDPSAGGVDWQVQLLDAASPSGRFFREITGVC
jgi:hypothetical protein